MTSTQNDAGLHFTTGPLEFTYHPGPIEFTALEDSYLFALEDSYLSALLLLLLPCCCCSPPSHPTRPHFAMGWSL